MGDSKAGIYGGHGGGDKGRLKYFTLFCIYLLTFAL